MQSFYSVLWQISVGSSTWVTPTLHMLGLFQNNALINLFVILENNNQIGYKIPCDRFNLNIFSVSLEGWILYFCLLSFITIRKEQKDQRFSGHDSSSTFINCITNDLCKLGMLAGPDGTLSFKLGLASKLPAKWPGPEKSRSQATASMGDTREVKPHLPALSQWCFRHGAGKVIWLLQAFSAALSRRIIKVNTL